MDFVWTPWRYRYIANAAKEERERCVLCDALAAGDDARVHIVLRAAKNFVILNKYPYTSGHVMVVPYAHGGDFAAFDQDALAEMMILAKRIQAAQESIYHPDGYNLGMNIGRSAGAGIANHLHLHLLPRWTGDTNFMTTIAETRLEPEELDETYRKLRQALGLNGDSASDPTVSLGGGAAQGSK
jgi:ATP adenylyltransferase